MMFDRLALTLARLVLALMTLGAPALAQEAEKAFIQIAALPARGEAEEAALSYAPAVPGLAAYEADGGWFVLAVGPFSPEEAAAKLVELRRSGAIPRDSFVVDGADFTAPFWPAGGAPASPATTTTTTTTAAPAAEPLPPEETLNEARAAEAALSRDDRKVIQEALAWYGHYAGKIDGSFGAGTRASIEGWQMVSGYEPTGVLTTLQRQTLIANHAADLAEFGMELVQDAEAGIEIQLPLGLVGFDGYDPPFARYGERKGSGLTVLLISEPGDAEALAGLYDLLQTLEIMPKEGERKKGEESFEINGLSEKLQAYAYAETVRGMVKGYLLTWDPARADKVARILPGIRASFRSVGDRALDPGLVPLEDAVKSGVLAGMEVRHPARSRSGLYVTADGKVLTLAETVEGCARVTVDFDREARVLASDAATGLALLAPAEVLAPRAHATWPKAAPKPGTAVTLAGYSWGERLPAAAMMAGRLEEIGGLDGEKGLLRLSLTSRDGDLGGPVLDGTGAVLGLLRPAAKKDVTLPEGVAFATGWQDAMAFLAANGVEATPAEEAALTPDAMAALAMGATTLVSCWAD